jgi:formyltetrahydrofolate synthetase
MIFHKYGDGAIELARKLLKTIERKESEMGEETVTVEQVRIKRLVNTVYKIAGWNGTDISELIEEGLLEENDLDL